MTLKVFCDTLCNEGQYSHLDVDGIAVEGKIGDLLSLLNDEVLAARVTQVDADGNMLNIWATLPEDSK